MPPKPFKPPRPSTSVKKSTSTKVSKPSTIPRKSNTSISKPRSKPPRISGSNASSALRPVHDSDSEPDPFSSLDKNSSLDAADAASETAVVDIPDEEERRENIPPSLLTRLLHECFTNDATRLSRDANAAVGRYMETFVREAMARAAFMRAEVEAGGGGAGDGFLEVEDLEKLSPQLLLDF